MNLSEDSCVCVRVCVRVCVCVWPLNVFCFKYAFVIPIGIFPWENMAAFPEENHLRQSGAIIIPRLKNIPNVWLFLCAKS